MPQDSHTGFPASESELNELTGLFLRYEGAEQPFSEDCRQAEARFNSIVHGIYWNRIHPKAGDAYTLPQFRSFIRNLCRKRLQGAGSNFPSV